MSRRRARATEVGELRQEARDLIRRLREARMASAGRSQPPRPAPPAIVFTADAAVVDLARGAAAAPADIAWDEDAEIQMREREVAAVPPAPAADPMAEAGPAPEIADGRPAEAPAPAGLRVSPEALGIDPIDHQGAAIALAPAEPARALQPRKRTRAKAVDAGALGLEPVIGAPAPIDLPPAAPPTSRQGAALAAALGLDRMVEPTLRRTPSRRPAPQAAPAPSTTLATAPATAPVVKPAKDPAAKAAPSRRPVSPSDLGLTSIGGEEHLVHLAAAEQPARPARPDPRLIGLEPILEPQRPARPPGRLPHRVGLPPSAAEGRAKLALAGTGSSDLAQIASLGPGLLWRLKAIGITSIEDLAGADPEAIRQALGNIGRLVRPADWVAAARDHLKSAPPRPVDRASAVTRTAILLSEGVAGPFKGVRAACLEAPGGALILLEGAPAAVLQASAELFAASGKSATLVDCRSNEAGILTGDWRHIAVDPSTFACPPERLTERALAIITGGAK